MIGPYELRADQDGIAIRYHYPKQEEGRLPFLTVLEIHSPRYGEEGYDDAYGFLSEAVDALNEKAALRARVKAAAANIMEGIKR